MKKIPILLAVFTVGTLLGDTDRVLRDGSTSNREASFSTQFVKLSDYRLEPASGAATAQFKFEEGSIVWVRVLGDVAVPRARLNIWILTGQSAVVHYAGRSTVFQADGNGLSTSISMLLLPDPANEMELEVSREGQTVREKYRLAYNPTMGEGMRVFIDPNCAAHLVDAKTPPKVKRNWAYVSCRYLRYDRDEGSNTAVELSVVWPSSGQTLQVDGIPLMSTGLSYWQFEVPAQNRKVTLRAADVSIDLSYQIPDRWRHGNVFLGIGPYAYKYDGMDDPFEAFYPVPTLYLSYRISESIRLVSFDFMTLGKKFLSDFGVYLQLNYFRLLDDRVVLNLMFGGHAMGYGFRDSLYIDPDFSQGVELVLSHFLVRRMNASLGAFIYPMIRDRYYYNLWLRYGCTSWFFELNYIAWQRIAQNTPQVFDSYGVSFGFPLFSFL